MQSKTARLTPSAPVEMLESRTLLSAAPVSVAARATTPATTTTTLAVSTPSALLGQNVKATVTVKASRGRAAGTVEFLDNGVPIIAAGTTVTAKLRGGKATYVFGAGDAALFNGTHQITAQYLSTSATRFSNSTSDATTVTVTPPTFTTEADGLQIATVQTGRGRGIAVKQKVNVLYTGILAADGTIFDYATANHGRGSKKFLNFKVGAGQVIRGFDEGTVGMTRGETRVLEIPSALGYGTTGISGTIPANADLVFLVTRI